jgi:hypothetical protein
MRWHPRLRSRLPLLQLINPTREAIVTGVHSAYFANQARHGSIKPLYHGEQHALIVADFAQLGENLLLLMGEQVQIHVHHGATPSQG